MKRNNMNKYAGNVSKLSDEKALLSQDLNSRTCNDGQEVIVFNPPGTARILTECRESMRNTYIRQFKLMCVLAIPVHFLSNVPMLNLRTSHISTLQVLREFLLYVQCNCQRV